ncbi:MAG: chitobiase/beta-hexosaminidase C-terminal domain-containing protein, partial [Muribaculaceae bacterium]|nr:chitobiase/beta-hexosaminidase C-terminal domain-containing protein [Muribaculaceae bacterium]
MLPLLVAAQGWPASYGGVVLVVDNDTQKNDVINNAATYTKWFDLIFLGNGQTVTSENINTFAAAKTGFIAYFQDLNQATAKSYLDAGYWGYRYRTSSASNAEATRNINAALNATFVVGDMYGNSTDKNVLKQWLKFNYKDGNYQSAICDNSLSVQMRDNNDNGEAWNDQGLHSDYIAKHYCLNYVDGATNDIAKKRSMYAFILTRPGTPIVFYGDWNNNSASHKYVNGYRFLERMIAVRHAVGINNQAAIQGSTGHASGKYYYTVYGTKGSVLVRLGKDYVNQSTPDGYTEVWKDDIDGNNRFSVYISNNVARDYNDMLTNSANVRGGDSEPIGFPIIDKASGHYTNSVSVNIKPNNNRTTLVFTTDGTMPTYLSEKVTDAVNGRTLNLTETTTLKVGVVETDGKTVNISNTVVA